MKKIYRGILFVALFAVAIFGVGGTEGGNSIFAIFILVAIMALMAKAGMMAKPVSKKDYYKYYK